jgi:phosphatidylserine decarboxylase
MEEHLAGTFPPISLSPQPSGTPGDSAPPRHLTTSPPHRPSTSPLTSIQPGGGFVVNLELAWGRLRRAFVRSFRRNYVRRMVEKRQGICPDCPHDIIDPRDLKFCRNVCGYWFHPEDDPFRWRERIPLARAGWGEVVFFSMIGLALAAAFAAAAIWGHPLFWAPLAIVLVLWAFVVSFFRDPPRTIPTDSAALLSPADGTITDITEVEAAGFPGERALRIGIFLSIFNVHVNRIPRSGRVVNLRYFPGAFLDARHPDCSARNEQLWLDLEEAHSGRRVRVKQISGAVARRIVCWLKQDESVQAGDRYGMIKFGSRTEVLVPAGEPVEMLAKVGDKVKGGATILLRFKN